MKNVGLQHVKNLRVNNFTTKFGLKLRRVIHSPFRQVLKLATKRKVFLESYPKLKPNTPYIFASTHSFDEDIVAALSVIDRNAYVLLGTTNQIECNPQIYAAWINGMIYVNRLDKESRKDAVSKMKFVLENGSSVLLYPEGGWNNTENLLCQPLFAGPYTLAKETGLEVVPIATFNEAGSNEIYIRVGEPMKLSQKGKREALDDLRNSLGTMMYEHIERHSTPLVRSQLGANYRQEFMEQRRLEYLRVKWTRDIWDEELAFYHDKERPLPIKIRESLKNVNITKNNAYIMAPILERIEEDEQYDFKTYMKKNWNK